LEKRWREPHAPPYFREADESKVKKSLKTTGEVPAWLWAQGVEPLDEK